MPEPITITILGVKFASLAFVKVKAIIIIAKVQYPRQMV